MTVADLVEGIEEWKEVNAALTSWETHWGIKNPEYGNSVRYELNQAEQKIKTAIREMCDVSG